MIDLFGFIFCAMSVVYSPAALSFECGGGDVLTIRFDDRMGPLASYDPAARVFFRDFDLVATNGFE